MSSGFKILEREVRIVFTSQVKFNTLELHFFYYVRTRIYELTIV